MKEIAFYSRENFKPLHRLLQGMKGPSMVVLIENETLLLALQNHLLADTHFSDNRTIATTRKSLILPAFVFSFSMNSNAEILGSLWLL